MSELRPRQTQAVHDLTRAYASGYHSPILVAPTAFGKTHTSTEIIRRALAKGNSVWFLAHLKEILDATASKLDGESIPFGMVAAGYGGDRRQRVQVASRDTLIGRLDRYERPSLMIVDEAHLAVGNRYQEIIQWACAGPKHYQRGGGRLLHLTATPQRLDGRGMGEVADIIINTCSTQDLIEEGLAPKLRYYEPPAMDGKAIVGSALHHYRKYADRVPAIGFCVSVAEAEKAAQEFRDAGYRAIAVDGESDPVLRDGALTGIQDGGLDVVFNCKLWVAGVDAPRVGCIIDMRPTDSLTQYLQGLGRGMRLFPGKEFLIYLDMVGNRHRHGHPTAARTWSLLGHKDGSGGVANPAPVKVCPGCFSVVPSFVTNCSCGHQFEVVQREVNRVDGELHEVADTIPTTQSIIAPTIAFKTENELLRVFKARGTRRPELRARAAYKAQYAALARQHGIAGAEKLAREFNAQP